MERNSKRAKRGLIRYDASRFLQDDLLKAFPAEAEAVLAAGAAPTKPMPGKRATKSRNILSAFQELFPHGEHAGLLVERRDEAIVNWHKDHKPPLPVPSSNI